MSNLANLISNYIKVVSGPSSCATKNINSSCLFPAAEQLKIAGYKVSNLYNYTNLNAQGLVIASFLGRIEATDNGELFFPQKSSPMYRHFAPASPENLPVGYTPLEQVTRMGNTKSTVVPVDFASIFLDSQGILNDLNIYQGSGSNSRWSQISMELGDYPSAKEFALGLVPSDWFFETGDQILVEFCFVGLLTKAYAAPNKTGGHVNVNPETGEGIVENYKVPSFVLGAKRYETGFWEANRDDITQYLANIKETSNTFSKGIKASLEGVEPVQPKSEQPKSEQPKSEQPKSEQPKSEPEQAEQIDYGKVIYSVSEHIDEGDTEEVIKSSAQKLLGPKYTYLEEVDKYTATKFLFTLIGEDPSISKSSLEKDLVRLEMSLSDFIQNVKSDKNLKSSLVSELKGINSSQDIEDYVKSQESQESEEEVLSLEDFDESAEPAEPAQATQPASEPAQPNITIKDIKEKKLVEDLSYGFNTLLGKQSSYSKEEKALVMAKVLITKIDVIKSVNDINKKTLMNLSKEEIKLIKTQDPNFYFEGTSEEPSGDEGDELPEVKASQSSSDEEAKKEAANQSLKDIKNMLNM